MPNPNRPFGGFIDAVASIDMLRAAAGIYIPNNRLRDHNASVYTGTRTGEDSLTWNLSDFRDWFWYGTEPGVAYGSQASARVGFGAYDAIGMYLSTAAITSGQDIQNNHRVLAATVFSRMLPFSRYFAGHYGKPISLALTAQVPIQMTIGTHVMAYLACYSSAYAYLSAVELEFDTEVVGSGATTLLRLEARTKSALHASTAYVQLHIGVASPDSSLMGINIYSASLYLNPDNDDLATDGSPVLWLDMEDVKLRAGLGFGFQAPGVQDAQMLDGSTVRANVNPELKYQFTADFMRKMSNERMRRLLAIWNLGTRGLGAYVPEAVPVCIDLGLGTAPFWAYYWPTEASFAGALNAGWTLAAPTYDITIAFREA